MIVSRPTAPSTSSGRLCSRASAVQRSASSPLRPPAPPRSPWQLFYAKVLEARQRWYSRRQRRLPVPVISVGNLQWGGSGKTPLVETVAAHLRDAGWRPCILSRGYGRRSSGMKIVSTGDGPAVDVGQAGDEPYLLAERLPGCAVVVAEDRFRGAQEALQSLRPSPRVFLLDDAFSHLRLFRDLDLLAIPAADPFAGGRLFPSGRLREPLAAAARADALVVTEAGAGGATGAQVAAALRPFGFSGAGFSSAVTVARAALLGGQELRPGCRVLLVSGIARPDRFARSAREQQLEVEGHLEFSDHHRYPRTSVRRILEAWRACGAEAVLTTSKDRVKLQGRLAAPLAELRLRAEPEEAFWLWLEERSTGLAATS